MIKSYSAQPSFMRINETKNHRFSSDIELCSKEKIVCDEILKEKETMTCKEVDAHCVLIRFSTKTKIRLKKKGLHFKYGTEEDVHYLSSKPHTHHKIRLKVFQIERLNLERAKCITNWNEILWISEDSKPDYRYSLKLCEQIRYELTGKVEYLQYDFPCQPACHEIQYKISNSKLYHNSESVAISFSVLPVITHMQETRKTTLVDILCYLGGASSLFMGCSCVTLMEMFVFLFKLVANSVWSKEAPEPDDSYYEEKYRFEFSDHRNKRRYAICDRETMEKYLLSTNSMEVKSINLDKRLSVFSHSAIRKAPKLKALKDNRNFEHIDIFDEVMESDSMKEEIRTIPKDEYSVEYQDEYEGVPLRLHMHLILQKDLLHSPLDLLFQFSTTGE
uniref:Amiloride-sensitive sodium channel n=1 Tax=Caenorhabditis tropicalis TaxID=1561998 RepID=A0A1I7V381_9PELO